MGTRFKIRGGGSGEIPGPLLFSLTSLRGKHCGRRDLAEGGASAVEYGLLVSLIAAVIFVSVVAMGMGTFGLYDDTCTAVAGAVNGSSC